MTGRLPVITDSAELVHWMAENEPDDGWQVDDLETACSRVGRNAGPALLIDLHREGVLTRALYVAMVGHVWSMAEWPLRQLEGHEWLELFHVAGYTRAMEDGPGRRWPRPRKPRTLYRGADEANRLGWSWTDNLETARWFANREVWKSPGQVWTLTVDPRWLLARIDTRKESEYVIDGGGLDPDDVREVPNGAA